MSFVEKGVYARSTRVDTLGEFSVARDELLRQTLLLNTNAAENCDEDEEVSAQDRTDRSCGSLTPSNRYEVEDKSERLREKPVFFPHSS